MGLYSVGFMQGTKQVKEDWTAITYDQILAYIGGYAALVWAVIEGIVGGYQSFRYESHLMQSMYTEEKKDRWDEEEESDEEDRSNEEESDEEDEIKEIIRNRKPYHYYFTEVFKARLIYYFCCCFK